MNTDTPNDTTLQNGKDHAAFEDSLEKLRRELTQHSQMRIAEKLVDGASSAFSGVKFGKLAERYGPFVLQVVFSAGVIVGLVLTVGIAALPDILTSLSGTLKAVSNK